MALSTTSSCILTGAIVCGGKIAQGDMPGVKQAVGTGGLVISLSVLSEINAEFARKFAVLILTTAFLMYVPTIAWHLGLLDKKQYPKAPTMTGVMK